MGQTIAMVLKHTWTNLRWDGSTQKIIYTDLLFPKSHFLCLAMHIPPRLMSRIFFLLSWWVASKLVVLKNLVWCTKSVDFWQFGHNPPAKPAWTHARQPAELLAALQRGVHALRCVGSFQSGRCRKEDVLAHGLCTSVPQPGRIFFWKWQT